MDIDRDQLIDILMDSDLQLSQTLNAIPYDVAQVAWWYNEFGIEDTEDYKQEIKTWHAIGTALAMKEPNLSERVLITRNTKYTKKELETIIHTLIDHIRTDSNLKID